MTHQSTEIRDAGRTCVSGKDRVTATEVVDGVEYRIVLEREGGGQYREVSVTRVDRREADCASGRPI